MNINEQLQDYLSKSASSKGIQKSESTSSFFGLLGQNKSEFSSSTSISSASSVPQDGSHWYTSLTIPGLMSRQPPENLPQSRCQKFFDMFPTLGYYQRLCGFGFCLITGITLIFLAVLQLPMLILRARKFAVLFTMGSLSVIASVAFLIGPAAYFAYMFSKDRLTSTILYFGCLLATLYATMTQVSLLLVVPLIVVQVFALVWNVASHIPGGQAGCKFMAGVLTSLCKRSVSQTLPV